MELSDAAGSVAVQDPSYVQLWIRSTSRDEIDIGFAYQLQEGRDIQSAEKEYFERTHSYLNARFGADLVSWDIGGPVLLVRTHIVEG